MKTTTTLLLALYICSITSHAQTYEWAKGIGGIDDDIVYSIAVDGSGNVYSTGWFRGTVDFDPGAGTYNLTSGVYDNMFILKLDAAGNFIWAKSFGGSGSAIGMSIAVDGSGSLYTTGRFHFTADFDPGPGTSNLTSAGSSDIFILKLDTAGNFLWAKRIGGNSEDQGQSIAVDGSGNVYTTGYFSSSADFDPGAGTSILTAAGLDIFISKLDASGNFLWAKRIGGTYDDFGNSIAVDDLGNVYTTGRFRATIDFDPGAAVYNLSNAGLYDIFVLKLDANGDFLWAKSMGGFYNDYSNSIALDAANNVYTTGWFNYTADFDPGVGIFNLTTVGGDQEVFISKLDSSGNFIWAKSMGGNNNDRGNSIAIDDFGNVYTTGVFSWTADFDPGVGIYNLTSAGLEDVFISKLDASGNFIWAKSMGGSSEDFGQSIALDGFGNVYTTGYFIGTVDFDPGAGTNNLTSAGIRDIFIHKMSQCIILSGSNVVSACNSYTWIDGNTYTASNNTATHTLTNAAGCDSVFTLNLTINNSTTGTDLQSACNTFTWIDGNTYTASNTTATHTLTNAAGCDSVITLNLTINNSTTGTDVQSACNTFTWIDGNTYTSSNTTATHTLTNVAGCDSVVTLNLTINSVSDLTTSSSGETISANNTSATYQWLDCGNNYAAIAGETGQSFTATANGNYAVELTENGCVDTSACVAISTVGIIENSFGNALKIYPNPTHGALSIDLGASFNEITVIIRNLLGQDVLKKSFGGSNVLQLNIPGEAGIYLIELSSGDKKAIVKVVKE